MNTVLTKIKGLFSSITPKQQVEPQIELPLPPVKKSAAKAKGPAKPSTAPKKKPTAKNK